MRYTKKPVTVEAVQFMGLTDLGDPQFDTTPTGGEIPEWLMEAVAGPEGSVGSVWTQGITNGSDTHRWLTIGAMEGQRIASPGDWIIQGIKGEIYPCKPDIFAEIYDVATDDPKLEALDTSGRQAIAAAMDRAGEVPNPVFATREPRSYVIGEGFKTVGDSDGFNGA